MLILCVGSFLARALTPAQLRSREMPKDLVFVGTVTKIYPLGSSHSQRRWAVLTRVDTIVSGEFSGTKFTFTVHSPSRAGLRVGRAYTITAVWTTEGYVVDEFALKEARAETKPSPKR